MCTCKFLCSVRNISACILFLNQDPLFIGRFILAIDEEHGVPSKGILSMPLISSYGPPLLPPLPPGTAKRVYDDV